MSVAVYIAVVCAVVAPPSLPWGAGGCVALTGAAHLAADIAADPAGLVGAARHVTAVYGVGLATAWQSLSGSAAPDSAAGEGSSGADSFLNDEAVDQNARALVIRAIAAAALLAVALASLARASPAPRKQTVPSAVALATAGTAQPRQFAALGYTAGSRVIGAAPALPPHLSGRATPGVPPPSPLMSPGIGSALLRPGRALSTGSSGSGVSGSSPTASRRGDASDPMSMGDYENMAADKVDAMLGLPREFNPLAQDVPVPSDVDTLLRQSRALLAKCLDLWADDYVGCAYRLYSTTLQRVNAMLQEARQAALRAGSVVVVGGGTGGGTGGRTGVGSGGGGGSSKSRARTERRREHLVSLQAELQGVRFRLLSNVGNELQMLLEATSGADRTPRSGRSGGEAAPGEWTPIDDDQGIRTFYRMEAATPRHTHSHARGTGAGGGSGGGASAGGAHGGQSGGGGDGAGQSQSVMVSGTVEAPLFNIISSLFEVDLMTTWLPNLTSSSKFCTMSRFKLLSSLTFGLPWPVADRQAILYGYGDVVRLRRGGTSAAAGAGAEAGVGMGAGGVGGGPAADAGVGIDDDSDSDIAVCVYVRSYDDEELAAGLFCDVHGNPAVPPHIGDGLVEVAVRHGGFVLIPQGPTTTLVRAMFNFDARVSIPTVLVNWVTRKFCFYLLVFLRSVAGTLQGDDFRARIEGNPWVYAAIKARFRVMGLGHLLGDQQ